MNLQFLADGLIAGALIGLGAIGVTLTYSILQFANFTHGEFISWGSYFALTLAGALTGVIGVAEPIGPLSFGWPLILAGVMAAILTGLLALALDRVLFSKLRTHGNAIVMVMASFGASMALRSLLEFIFTSQPAYFSREIQMALPMGLGIKLTPDQIFLLAMTAVIVVALERFMALSATGRAMRAVSENPVLARVAGVNVDHVIRATWMIGGALACAAGIMLGVTVQIRPYMGFDLLLPLFAAAILGGIGSVPGAVIGGLIVGISEAIAVQIVGADYRAAIAFVILIAVLLIKPTGLFGVPPVILDLASYAAFFLVTALSYGIICLGLNVQWGQTGLFNVGVAGFVAIGAYTSALLTTPDADARLGGFGLPIWIGWIIAPMIAGLAGGIIGAITLRLRADYLAITTFGIAIAIQLIALNAEGLTGGPFGIGFIPRPFASLAETAIAFNIANLGLVAVVTAAVYIALERLVRSPWGRVLRAIREDETAAISLGKDANRFRLQAFALGCAIMGLAGAIQAHFIGFIAPENYLSAITFQVWAMLIIGGSGNNRGALLGALLVWALWSVTGAALSAVVPAEHQARAAALQIVIIGVVLAAVLVLRPRGLLGETKTVSRHLED